MLTKYRPKTFDDVIGHAPIVKALRNSTARAFLFTGPSGVGKTTLARIVCAERGIDPYAITEIDGASTNGVDAMRDVVQGSSYFALQGSKKAIIVDECHQLTKQAWQSLLKAIEEPPAHVRWIFCTTEGAKVPDTIKTRCEVYELRLLPQELIMRIMTYVAAQEGIALPAPVLGLILNEAAGSPRRALSLLSKCRTAVTLEEAHALMARDAPVVEAIDLARCIFSTSFSMQTVRPILAELKDAPAESVRIAIMAYAFSVFLKATDPKFAARVMGAFSTPCVETNKMAEIALRVARLIYGVA